MFGGGTVLVGCDTRESGSRIADALSAGLYLQGATPELLGVLPTWPYSAGWGYFPSGILGIIVVVLIIMALKVRYAAR